MLEHDMEDLIAAYPGDFFPRHLFRLCGRQRTFKGVGRFDLHFLDQFNSNILMELKAVPARYEDASQLGKYRDAMQAQGGERVIMWLVAPLIPSSVREFLEHIGIEFTEIHESEYKRVARLRGVTVRDEPTTYARPADGPRVQPPTPRSTSYKTEPTEGREGTSLAATRATWVSFGKAAAVLGRSERTIRRLVALGQLESRAGLKRGRNGKFGREIGLSSLADHAHGGRKDGEQSPFLVKAARTLIRTSAGHGRQKESVRKLEIIKPLLDYLADPGARGQFHRLTLASGEMVANSDMLTQYLAEQHRVSKTSIWRWKRLFEERGNLALGRKPRADKGRSHFAAKHRDLAELAARVYMGNANQPAQSKAAAYDAVCASARSSGVTPPSYECVRAFLSNLPRIQPQASRRRLK